MEFRTNMRAKCVCKQKVELEEECMKMNFMKTTIFPPASWTKKRLSKCIIAFRRCDSILNSVRCSSDKVYAMSIHVRCAYFTQHVLWHVYDTFGTCEESQQDHSTGHSRTEWSTRKVEDINIAELELWPGCSLQNVDPRVKLWLAGIFVQKDGKHPKPSSSVDSKIDGQPISTGQPTPLIDRITVGCNSYAMLIDHLLIDREETLYLYGPKNVK